MSSPAKPLRVKVQQSARVRRGKVHRCPMDSCPGPHASESAPHHYESWQYPGNRNCELHADSNTNFDEVPDDAHHHSSAGNGASPPGGCRPHRLRTDRPGSESGVFYGSGPKTLTGPVLDQSGTFPDLANTEIQQHADQAIHRFL
jgi:hypothetical protein